jgi:hypothetical protein
MFLKRDLVLHDPSLFPDFLRSASDYYLRSRAWPR